MKRKLLSLLMAGTIAVSLVACGGSGTSSSSSSAEESSASSSTSESSASSSASTSSASSEESSSSSEASSESSSSASSSSDSEGVPTEAAKAPEGIKLAYVMGNASMSGGYIPGMAIEDICNELGWELQTWDGEGDPGKENDAIMSAISWGANAILTASVQATNAQSSLQAANEAGIPIGSLSCGADTPNEVVSGGEFNYAFDIGPYYYALGEAMAEWIAEHTEAEGKVACWDFEGENSIYQTKMGFYDKMDELGIEYEEVGAFTFDQIGDTLNRQVSTYLINNPETEFIYFPFDPAAQPVAEFLDVNGTTGVKVLGVLGNKEMCDMIATGSSTATATAAYDNNYMGYAAVDQIIRCMNGQDLIEPHGENVPFAIIDSSNVPEGERGYVANDTYAEEFYALWK